MRPFLLYESTHPGFKLDESPNFDAQLRLFESNCQKSSLKRNYGHGKDRHGAPSSVSRNPLLQDSSRWSRPIQALQLSRIVFE